MTVSEVPGDTRGFSGLQGPAWPNASAVCRECPHVTVCICTFKRPTLLKRTLQGLEEQLSDGRFTYSVVVVDNDRNASAGDLVAAHSEASALRVDYCIEPEQNIALARNRAVLHASGDYVAFIDDDECPSRTWLARLLAACEAFGVDGALGPVRPQFDTPPPGWLLRSGLCERTAHQTGQVLHFRQTRTGNALLKRGILHAIDGPFRAAFANGGEDQDLFRRLIECGYTFAWCSEAVVYEVVPPERQTRRYYLKRALLRGQNERFTLTVRSVVKSLVAVPIYVVVLVIVAPFGQHRLMTVAVKLLDHLGKLLGSVGIIPVRGAYLAD